MVWITKQEDVEIREMESLGANRVDEQADVPTYQKIHSIADNIAPVLASVLLLATNSLKDNVRVSRVRQGFADANLNMIQREVDWQIYENNLRNIREPIEQTILQAGNEMKIHLPPTMRDFDFEMNGDIQNWINTRENELVNYMRNSSRVAFEDGLRQINNEDDVGAFRKASFLLPIIGLTQRQTRAVNNYRRNLIEQEITFDRIESLTNNYAENSLEYRAQRFGDNESILYANEGYSSLVRAGVGAGVLNRALGKKAWIVTPDDRLCPLCMEMIGVEVGIDRMFDTPYGLVDEPPMHVRCRCGVDYSFPVD